MKKDIIWNENGWTVVQDADAEKHILEISCYAESGMVTQVIERHHDGEETKLTKTFGNGYTLPMPLEDFKKAVADWIK